MDTGRRLAKGIHVTTATIVHKAQFSGHSHPLGPIGGCENHMRYTVAIVPGDEVKKTLYPLTDSKLPVTVGFRMTWNTGDATDHEAESERLLGLIEKAPVQDRTLTGNAIDFYTVGSGITMGLFT